MTKDKIKKLSDLCVNLSEHCGTKINRKEREENRRERKEKSYDGKLSDLCVNLSELCG